MNTVSALLALGLAPPSAHSPRPPGPNGPRNSNGWPSSSRCTRRRRKKCCIRPPCWSANWSAREWPLG